MKSFATAIPIRPIALGFPSRPGIGIGIGLHPNCAAVLRSAPPSGPSGMTRAGSAAPPAHRTTARPAGRSPRQSCRPSGCPARAAGLSGSTCSDDGRPKRLQRLGRLEPLLEGVRMDRSEPRSCRRSSSIRTRGPGTLAMPVHDLVPRGDGVAVDPDDLRPGRICFSAAASWRQPLVDDPADRGDRIDLPAVLDGEEREQRPRRTARSW